MTHLWVGGKVRTILIYDIPDDKKRKKIAEACKDYGLHRIQWSAFTGRLNRNLREELMLRLDKILGEEEGDIKLFPICNKDLKQKQEIKR